LCRAGPGHSHAVRNSKIDYLPQVLGIGSEHLGRLLAGEWRRIASYDLLDPLLAPGGRATPNKNSRVYDLGR
jgi:hypothetical protein